MQQREPRLAFSLSLLCVTLGLDAQSPRLVQDINSRLVSTPSSPTPFALASPYENHRFVNLLDATYFVAFRPGWGRELYRTRGTAATTEVVADIVPGPGHAEPLELTVAGLNLFFTAFSPRHGRELWITDPIANRTYQVADINPYAADGANPKNLVAFGREVFFSAEDYTGNAELWRSDGTKNGTRLIKDIEPGAGASDPSHLLLFGSQVLFIAKVGGKPFLHSTDGTTAGTVRLTTVPTPQNQSPMVRFASHVYFAASTPTSGEELWRTDGTIAGTTRALDVWPGPESSRPRHFCVAAGKLYFTASGRNRSGQHTGEELCATNGQSLEVFDLNPGPATSIPRELLAIQQGRREFLTLTANSARTGREPWIVDANGPRVLDLRPGADGTSPFCLTQGPGDALYFVAFHRGLELELFRSDGTVPGTRVLADIHRYNHPGGARPAFLTPIYGGDMLFAADDGPHGMELWRTDGTAHGTRMLSDIHPIGTGTRGCRPRFKAMLDGRTYFTASADGRESTLWVTDGTAAGTIPEPALLGQDLRNITEVVALGRKLLLAAEGSVEELATGPELWVVDLDQGKTRALELTAGPGGSFPKFLTVFRGEVYFSASGTLGAEPSGTELWKSDGTPEGTYLLKDIYVTGGAHPASSRPKNFTPLGNYLYFTARDRDHGEELWRTDGSADGTELVIDVFRGPTDSQPDELTPLGDRLLFLAEDLTRGRELWSTDGTAQGTVCIEFVPGPSTGFARTAPIDGTPALYRVGQRVYVQAQGSLNGAPPNVGIELWSTDGTVAGTRFLKDLRPGPASSMPCALVPIGLNGEFVFVADLGAVNAYSPALMRSDGTSTGTKLVKGMPAGFSVFFPDYHSRLGSRHAVFKVPTLGRYHSQGHHLLITDGSALGTRWLVRDLSSLAYRELRPGAVPTMDGKLLLIRDEPKFGAELWVLDAFAIAEPLGRGCSSRAVPATLTATDPSGPAVHTRIQNAPPRAPGLLIVGQRGNRLALTPSCALILDFRSPQTYLPLATDALGRWRGAIPTAGAVRNFPYVIQAALDGANWHHAPELTNGVVLTTGQ